MYYNVKEVSPFFLSFFLPSLVSAASACDVKIAIGDTNGTYDNAVTYAKGAVWACAGDPTLQPSDCYRAWIRTAIKEWSGTDAISWAAIQAYTGTLGNRMMYVVDDNGYNRTFLPASASSGVLADVQLLTTFTPGFDVSWEFWVGGTVNLTEEWVSVSLPGSSPLCSLPPGEQIEKEVGLRVEKYIVMADNTRPSPPTIMNDWSNWSSRVVSVYKTPSVTLRVEPVILDFALVPVMTEKTLNFLVIPETDSGIQVTLQYVLTGELSPSVKTEIINPADNTVINSETITWIAGQKLERAVRVHNISNTSGEQQMMLTVTASIS
ncbi:TPA: hypothetical protein ACY3HI_004739 [Citrobacter braakii]